MGEPRALVQSEESEHGHGGPSWRRNTGGGTKRMRKLMRGPPGHN